MAKFLGEIKGKTITSLIDQPDIRRIFAGFHMETTNIKYKVGSGKGGDGKEVLIFSLDLRPSLRGYFDILLQGAQKNLKLFISD